MSDVTKAGRDAAFEKIMGALDMPDDNSPEYDEWLFDRAYQAGRESMRWIPVNEKLPEIVKHWGGRDNKMYGGADPVLAFSGGKLFHVADYYEGGTWADSAEGSKLENVTHWMPLPLAPGKESE